jgi:hypothetical protein
MVAFKSGVSAILSVPGLFKSLDQTSNTWYNQFSVSGQQFQDINKSHSFHNAFYKTEQK